jgi:HEAT repeat protein
MLVRPAGRSENRGEDDVVDLSGLLDELNARDPSVRRRAAQSLRDVASAAPALCDRLEKEADASVRATLLTSLIRGKSVEVARRLTELLRSEDVALRSDVIEALRAMPAEARPSLGRLLDDPDSDVRIFVVNVLTGIDQPWARSFLSDVLTKDSHVNVCLAAVDGLVGIRDRSFILPLTVLAERFPHVPLVQYAAVASIRRIQES